MYCCDGESVVHLLLHCSVTHFLWTFMLPAFEIHWEAQLQYLEFDSRMHNVDCLVGTESSLLLEHGEDLR